MLRRIELLVHAGAPSTRSDDARYTAQANAYLDFAGQRVGQTGHISTETALNQITEPIGLIDGAVEQNNANQGYDPSTFLEDTQSAWIALESQLDASSFIKESTADGTSSSNADRHPAEAHSDHFHSAKQDFSAASKLDEHPSLKRARDDNSEKDHGRLKKVSDTIADAVDEGSASTRSSYLISPVLDRSAKRARIEPHIVHRSRDNIAPAAPSTFHRHDGMAEGRNADIVQSEGFNEAEPNTSELPTSYSLSKITSGSSRARLGISQRSTSDPGPQIGSISPTALRAVPESEHTAPPLNRSSSEPSRSLATKGAPKSVSPGRAYHNAGAKHLPAAASKSEPHVPPSNTANDLNTVSATVQEAYAALSTEIHPPPPKVSLDVFKTHITPALDILVQLPDLAECYKPLSISRDLRPTERGHWLIKIPRTNHDWTLERQLEFWRFLEKYVGSGQAGWGVWCTREQDPDQRNGFGIVKVYCWGEVVKHLYHLLYISSKSKVRRMGLQWIGGDGEVVVQMKSM